MVTAFRSVAGRFLVALLVAFAAGCATPRTTLPEVPPRHTLADFRDQPFAVVADPWERFNRNMYQFNYNFDKYLFLPVVHGYEFITPVFVQKRVSNFYSNLTDILNMGNSVFQLKGKEAATTLGRLVTNSTLGLGGLFDPATKWGLKQHPEDFGKTLGYWGVPSGPYLVLPVFGPSSLRDAAGLGVDSGIKYALYWGSGLDGYDDSFAIASGVTVLQAVDARHLVGFRYYESGYPFEYYIVRFLYHEKRELESTKK